MAETREKVSGAPAAGRLPDVLQFMRGLWAVAHALERASKRMSGDVGVTGPQRLVLRVVGLSPGLSPGELAATLHVHPSTLTGVLQRLVAQRLLARSEDARDGRRAVLNLTRGGMRANAARNGTVEAAVAAALRQVSARDRAAASRVLERLARQLDPSSLSAPARRRPRSRGRNTP
jgi:MarR family transcriptional regulator, organic hydroperoxide resistance regulator